MSLYFDAKTGLFRIRITKGGRRIRKALPKGTTEESAREIHARLVNDMLKMHHHAGAIPGWEADVNQSLKDRASWIHTALQRAQRRSRTAGRNFNLTIDDLEFIARRSGGRCEITGLPFSDERVGAKGFRPYRQSLDRIDSSDGYRLENCRLVAVAVNLAMGTWGPEAMHRIAVGLVLNRFYPPWLDLHSTKMHNALSDASKKKTA